MASLPSQGRWSTKDTVRLLERMEENLPPNDSRAFPKTQAHLDWGKVAFGHFTAEMCRLKWQALSHKVRKFRTLSELVVEAKEQVQHAQDLPKYKKHPDFPKRPLTSFLRFYKEQRAQCLQMYPKLSNKQLTKVLSDKYRQLPKEVRQRYVEEFQKDREDYAQKVARFRADHPDLVQNDKKQVVPTRHRTEVPEKLQGNVTTPSAGPEEDGRLPQTTFLREPQKPPMNGFHKFQQDLWCSEELGHLPVRRRMLEISRRWLRVPQSMKQLYQSQAEQMHRQYWLDLDKWLRSLSPEEYAAYTQAQASCGKRKCTMVQEGPSPKFRRRDPLSSAKELQEGPREKQGLLAPGTDSSQSTGDQNRGAQGSGENGVEDGKEDEESSSSDSSSEDEDPDGSSEDPVSDSSSSADSSDLDSF